MKANYRVKLAILPLLACSTGAIAAEPITLSAQQMDRITAGAESLFENLSKMSGMMSAQSLHLLSGEGLSLNTEQLSRITQLASSEPLTFRQSNTGEWVATKQLHPGLQLVLVKERMPGGSTSLAQQSQGNTVTTHLLNPGESLSVRQISSGGVNYLYLSSGASSSVVTSRQTGL